MARQLGRPVYTHGPVIRSLFIAYVVLAIAVVGGLWWQYTDIHQQCHENAQNREALRDGIFRSLTNLGYAWDEANQEPVRVSAPAIDYYKDHPDEVATQVELIRQQADGFPPIRC